MWANGLPVNPRGGNASRGEAHNRPGGVTGDSGDLPAVRAGPVRSVASGPTPKPYSKARKFTR